MSEQETKKETAPAKLIVSSSPHAHSGSSVSGIMLDVIIAMVPAIAAAVFYFGFDAVRFGVRVAQHPHKKIANKKIIDLKNFIWVFLIHITTNPKS